MKKLLALLLALCMVLSLCACGSKGKISDAVGENIGTDENVEATENSATAPAETKPVEKLTGFAGEIPVNDPQAGLTANNDVGDITYLGSKLYADVDEMPAIGLFFEYTPQNEEETCGSFYMDVYYYAYQNGEDLYSTNVFYTDGITEGFLADTMDTECAVGETVTCCATFALNDFESPVEVEVMDYWCEEAVMSFTIDVASMEAPVIPEIPADDFAYDDEFSDGFSMEGYYEIETMFQDGVEYSHEDLEASGFANNTFVEFYPDGTVTVCFEGEAFECTYDEDWIYFEDDWLFYSCYGNWVDLEVNGVTYSFYTEETSAALVTEADGETYTTENGGLSITVGSKWYKGDPVSNLALTLYNEDMSDTSYINILDLCLNSYEQLLEIVQSAMSNQTYEEITIGNNTYQMLDSEQYDVTYLVGSTSDGYGIEIELRNVAMEDVMAMLESIWIY